MVDRTVYPVGQRPSSAVSQIFARCRVPADICLRISALELRSVEMIAMLGDSFDSVKAAFTRLAGGDAALGVSDAARERVLFWVLVSVLRASSCTRSNLFSVLRWKLNLM